MTPGSAQEWTNTRLVQECLRGDDRAWNVLVDRYKGLIYSIPLRYGAPPQDAADIFQAVCLDLFNELPKLREAEALQGWLVRVTANKCYHWKRGAEPSEELNEDQHQLPVDGALTPDVLADVERQQMLRDAVRKLAPRCRQMIELLFFEQPPLAYKDVASRLNLAIGSIGFIRGRCLKRLKSILQDKGF
ncbi:MAG TPA: sigma-70 family RNA polymerase sigma factor [Candidatus Limnocylindrales bacterium]|nr:sigma-70 family RNA polymerase sigma factor [Candidatus Limnocylindrales bacterium]